MKLDTDESDESVGDEGCSSDLVVVISDKRVKDDQNENNGPYRALPTYNFDQRGCKGLQGIRAGRVRRGGR